MSNNVTPIGKNIVTGAGSGSGGSTIVNHWAQVIAVAQPTFDAIVKLQPAMDWREDTPRHMIAFNLIWDIDEVDLAERLAIIPPIEILKEAVQLFEDAVHKSAPGPWFILALGAMLRGMTNAANVAPDYSFQIVDILLHGHEAQERGCEAGFSPPIFIDALRQVRLETDYVPGPAAILKACKAHRERFRELAVTAETLLELRQNADDARRTLDWKDDGDLTQNQDLRDRWKLDEEWNIPF